MNATSIPAADDLARRYGAAWNARDLDEIMSMPTPEMQFELKLKGYPPAHGAAEVAELTATLAGAFPIDGRVVEPAGQKLDLDGVDVITTADGLVATKHTYMDAFALRAQLGLGELQASGAAR